jgi:hypothetical protein
MVIRRKRSAAIMAFAALSSCATRPNADELAADTVVATRFAPEVDFGSFDTFALNPTVSVVRDVGEAGTLAPETAAGLIDRIAANMSARGYRQVAPSERPSLGLQASVNIEFNAVTTVYPGYLWGAPGYAGAPAYWGYPGGGYYAPWSYSTTVYKGGTLVVECVDLRDAAPTRLEMVWAAYAHAIAEELAMSLTPEALSAIDQAFVQSPYLKRAEDRP